MYDYKPATSGNVQPGSLPSKPVHFHSIAWIVYFDSVVEQFFRRNWIYNTKSSNWESFSCLNNKRTSHRYFACVSLRPIKQRLPGIWDAKKWKSLISKSTPFECKRAQSPSITIYASATEIGINLFDIYVIIKRYVQRNPWRINHLFFLIEYEHVSRHSGYLTL